MDWLKLNSRGILRGSLAGSSYTTQLIWIKLLAMANETRDRDGYLRFKEGKPYELSYIATTCGVTMDELMEAIDLFEDDIRDGHSRVTFASDGSLYLCNWSKYQEKPKKEEKPKMSDEQKIGMQTSLNNQNPDNARKVLTRDFHDAVYQHSTGEKYEVKDGE
jgi:hypothetical protein